MDPIQQCCGGNGGFNVTEVTYSTSKSGIVPRLQYFRLAHNKDLKFKLQTHF